MKFENTEVWGFEHAIRGMRNPKQSHDRSDSVICPASSGCKSKSCSFHNEYANGELKDAPCLKVGKNDMKLMQTLIRAGSEHRKFMRQVFVSVDITAPLYWWKEFDTYKVGTVANSTSTMHKLASKPITRDCFEIGTLIPMETINYLESLRQEYLETKEKEAWKKLIVNLPESWRQTRTVTMNYENLYSMVHQRKNHKLTEWSVAFMNWSKSLPYADALLFLESK